MSSFLLRSEFAQPDLLLSESKVTSGSFDFAGQKGEEPCMRG